MTNGRKIYIAVSWALVIVFLGIIFSLSAQNAEVSQELSDSFLRKIIEWLGLEISSDFIRSCAHMLEFAVLAVVFSNAVFATWENKSTPIIAFALTVLYAVSDEIHQIFVPGRAFQLSDILIDSTGALLGIIGCLLIYKFILIIKERGNKNGNT